MPQFILDEMLDREAANPDQGPAGGQIVVTQPRRLAAMSVAARVAEERGERLGESVGYQIALESVRPAAPCSVMFCTTGVLLRRMSSGPGGLDGVVRAPSARWSDRCCSACTSTAERGPKLESLRSGRARRQVHVIVDEVHERDLNTDFLLVLVSRLVKVGGGGEGALRITTRSPIHFRKLARKAQIFSGKVAP